MSNKKNFKQLLTGFELLILVSYDTAWILAQIKPFSNGEMLKDIITSIMEIL